MDLNKCRDYFDPDNIDRPIHIIGCGAVGSSIAELIARSGVKNIHLWDDDIVASHNISNQMYTEKDIGSEKTDALLDILKNIHPSLEEIFFKHGRYTNETISGYIFLCVDNIETRKSIVDNLKFNPEIRFITDIRMGLLDGLVYASDNNYENIKTLLKSMQFTHQEAKEQTPVSACGFELSVAPTVRVLTALAVANFINFVNTNKYKKLQIAYPFQCFTEAYDA